MSHRTLHPSHAQIVNVSQVSRLVRPTLYGQINFFDFLFFCSPFVYCLFFFLFSLFLSFLLHFPFFPFYIFFFFTLHLQHLLLKSLPEVFENIPSLPGANHPLPPGRDYGTVSVYNYTPLRK